ncbi:hypothetical protein BVC80_1157g16 [Macleaya cordata]|uniref:CHHC U11-48K-type domain-containing protein n=1 Tax=Macleaya cordata TaxID=56857 RepID=A0A200QR95_MACCD|nr:hypothetical protein BVC80_1157g16 [Macleaya cordata]
MNPPNPYFNPSFSFLPPNPNPNLNPNFSYFLPQNPQPLPPKPSSSTISEPPSTPDLHTTLSILKDFINLSENTVTSVSDLINSGNPTITNEDFISCPFDYRHRILPEFLFRHSLICPSSSCILNLDILESLHYPKSFKPKDELQKENRFVQSLKESDADLCLSIDDYGDFGSNFFYKDCPGVVCSSDLDNTKRTFTLPGILSIECANFISSNDGGTSDLPRECLRVLPSELWSMKSEIEVWREFPSSYSYTILRVCLCLQIVKESDLLKWVISNSPRYGIVIDVPMRDHMFLLLKLCLKAISREAYRSYKLLVTGISNEGDRDLNLKSLSFNSPVLVEVMMWLASQLSVLYGGANGKLFSVNMLKCCLQNAAFSSLLFPLEHEKRGFSSSKEGYGDSDSVVDGKDLELVGLKVGGNVKLEEPDEKCNAETSINGSSVFVSQVAAAVAALHERSLLEEKIKGLRLAGSLSKSQLLSEYSYVSMRAHEERGKRSNYRPILEHDGLLWQRYHNQDSSKMKTREELLAEERDYKRRRMSYRGKKVKRSTTEVMRDIIEEHMEEIKQAGGIGCFVKGSAENEMFAAGSLSVHDMTAANVLKSNKDSSEPSRGESHDCGKQSYSNHNMSARIEDPPPKDHISRNGGLKSSHSQQRRESHVHRESIEDHGRSIRKNKQEKEYGSRSPERYRSHGSHEHHRHRRERDEREGSRSKYNKGGSVSSHRSRYRDSRSFSSVSNLASDLSEGKNDQISEVNDRHKGRTYGRHRSESVRQNAIEDRYDPSGSDNRYEDSYDDISSGRKYVRHDKLYMSK